MATSVYSQSYKTLERKVQTPQARRIAWAQRKREIKLIDSNFKCGHFNFLWARRIGLPGKSHQGQLTCQSQESRNNKVGISKFALLQTPDSHSSQVKYTTASLIQANTDDDAMK